MRAGHAELLSPGGALSFAAALGLVAAVASQAGCYSPSPRSGSYLCADDGSCPTGQACGPCSGVCVARPSDDVCSLSVTVDGPAPCDTMLADACTTEHRALPVTITAYDAAGHQSTFDGPGTMSSTWGHARVDHSSAGSPQSPPGSDPFAFRFEAGRAAITVHLDRATPNNGTALLSARVGRVLGIGVQSLIVDPRPFTVGKPILEPKAATWADSFLGFPAVDRTPSGEYRMYVSGINNFFVDRTARARIGVATSPSAEPGSWSLRAEPVMADANGHLFAPTVLRPGDGSVRLFFTRHVTDSMGNAAPGQIVSARSVDGFAFEPIKVAIEATKFSCAICDAGSGTIMPWALVSPRRTDEWLLFFTSPIKNPTGNGTTMGLGRTTDGGGKWYFSPMPPPASGQAVGLTPLAVGARVIYDEADDVYRMWYAEGIAGAPSDACHTNIGYATSQDGISFSGARRTALKIADVPWAGPGTTGLYPGSVLRSDHGGWQLYFSPITNPFPLNLGCVAVATAVARAVDD